MDSIDRQKITEVIKKLCKERGISLNALRLKAGIDDGNWSRLIGGKRKWSLDHLESVARAAGVNVAMLVEDRPPIPIVAEVSATEGFLIPKGTITPALGYAANFFTEASVGRTMVYAFRVKDRSMLPSFPPKTVFYALRESHRDIKNEDLVVFSDHDGNSHVRQIILTPDTIILRGLNPTVADEVYPSHFLKLCDRIIHASFRPT